jgi:hypothetical protein
LVVSRPVAPLVGVALTSAGSWGACAEQLWSFGVDDIAWFDGKKWTRLEHPDNAKP